MSLFHILPDIKPQWREIIEGPIAITKPLFAQMAEKDIKIFEKKWCMSDSTRASRIMQALSREVPAISRPCAAGYRFDDSHRRDAFTFGWHAAFNDSVRASALGGQGLASSPEIIKVSKLRTVTAMLCPVANVSDCSVFTACRSAANECCDHSPLLLLTFCFNLISCEGGKRPRGCAVSKTEHVERARGTLG